MTFDGSLDLLVAQIQLQLESLQSMVITGPQPQAVDSEIAARVVSGLRTREIQSVLCVPATDASADLARAQNRGEEREVGTVRTAATRTFSPAEVGTPELARSFLASSGKLTIVAAPGILANPTALFLAAAADAVLLVAVAGRTHRAELARARIELSTAGCKLLGAVLVE